MAGEDMFVPILFEKVLECGVIICRGMEETHTLCGVAD